MANRKNTWSMKNIIYEGRLVFGWVCFFFLLHFTLPSHSLTLPVRLSSTRKNKIFWLWLSVFFLIYSSQLSSIFTPKSHSPYLVNKWLGSVEQVKGRAYERLTETWTRYGLRKKYISKKYCVFLFWPRRERCRCDDDDTWTVSPKLANTENKFVTFLFCWLSNVLFFAKVLISWS